MRGRCFIRIFETLTFGLTNRSRYIQHTNHVRGAFTPVPFCVVLNQCAYFPGVVLCSQSAHPHTFLTRLPHRLMRAGPALLCRDEDDGDNNKMSRWLIWSSTEVPRQLLGRWTHLPDVGHQARKRRRLSNKREGEATRALSNSTAQILQYIGTRLFWLALESSRDHHFLARLFCYASQFDCDTHVSPNLPSQQCLQSIQVWKCPQLLPT